MSRLAGGSRRPHWFNGWGISFSRPLSCVPPSSPPPPPPPPPPSLSFILFEFFLFIVVYLRRLPRGFGVLRMATLYTHLCCT